MRRLGRAALFTTQPRSWKHRIGFLTVLLVTGLIGTVEALSPPEHPIILVHGLNGDASTWDTFLDSVVRDGWVFGGQLQYRNNSARTATYGRYTRTVPIAADVYTITFTSGNDLTYQQQGEELERVISYILELTGKSKVICVGHSMGGLACRSYLSYARNPRVSQIITVGTPHLGAPLGTLATAFSAVWERIWNSTGARILQVGALELNQLNTDGLFRYRDTAVAYSSIIISGQRLIPTLEEGDGVVSTRSQNFGSVGLQIPLHTEVPIQLHGPCTELALHSCETRDENVRIAIAAEIVRRPIALVLKAETPTTRKDLPLRVKLFASSANRVGDLYLGLRMPDGAFLFQQVMGEYDLGWTTQVVPAARRLEAMEFRTIDFASLATGSIGAYTYYAVLARSNTDPYAGSWLSNLAQTRFTIEPQDAPPVRISRIFLNTQNQPRHPDSPFTRGYQFHLEIEVSGTPWPSNSVSSVEARSRRTGEVFSVPFNRTLPDRTKARYIFGRSYQGELGIFDVTVRLFDGRALTSSSHSLDRPRVLPLPQGLRVDRIDYPTRFTFDPVPTAGKYWCWMYRRDSLEVVYGCPTRAVPDFTIPANLLEFGDRYIIAAFAAEVDPTEPEADPVASPNESVSVNILFIRVGLSVFAPDY